MALIHPPSPVGRQCIRCGVPFTSGDTVVYNSDGEPGRATTCQPSIEYATEQMSRLSRHIFGTPTNAKENDMSDRTPIPVEDLVDAAINDGSDYHDGFDAYLSHEFDSETGVLTLTFKRDDEIGDDDNPDAEPFDPDHGDAVYRFQLIAEAGQ